MRVDRTLLQDPEKIEGQEAVRKHVALVIG